MQGARVFVSYARKNAKQRKRLLVHLAQLRRDGLISVWHDRAIAAGQSWAHEIDDNLRGADLVLLLITPDFMHSDYCYQTEMKVALERHKAKQARVIPIIAASCDFASAPFAQLQALPRDAKPISRWRPQDEGWNDVARGIREALRALPPKEAQPSDACEAELTDRRQLRVTLDLEIEAFDQAKQRLLRYGLAAFLGLEPEQVRIVDVRSGSVRVLLELPEDAAQRLVDALLEDAEGLDRTLHPLRVLSVEPVGPGADQRMATAAAAAAVDAPPADAGFPPARSASGGGRMNVLEWLKQACALVRTGKERGTAYLIHSRWAVTCAHVVEGVTAATLEFPWGKVTADVHGERDGKADIALLTWKQPVSARPLRLTTLRPGLNSRCHAFGFPEKAKTAPLPFPGEVRDPLARDDKKTAALAIYSDQAAAGAGAPLHGLSGSPVLLGRAVVGHLRRVLGDSGEAALGIVYACPTASVLALLPERLRAELAVPDFDAHRAELLRTVQELLDGNQSAREALTRAAGAPAGESARDLAERLFAMDCVKLLSLCNREHERLAKARTPGDRETGECVLAISLAALPALYELGAVTLSSVGEATLLTVDALDRLGAEALIARNDGRRLRPVAGEHGVLYGEPQLPAVEKLELGKAPVEQIIAQGIPAMRHWLAGKLGIELEGLSTDQADTLINEYLSAKAVGASGSRDDRFRYYYLFLDPARTGFAQKLGEVYPQLHVVQLRRSVGQGAALHVRIDQALKGMLRRRF